MKQTTLQRELHARGIRLNGLASALGVNKATVTRWSLGKIPAERVADVERITGVSRHVLRPDLFDGSDGSMLAAISQAGSEDAVNGRSAA